RRGAGADFYGVRSRIPLCAGGEKIEDMDSVTNNRLCQLDVVYCNEKKYYRRGEGLTENEKLDLILSEMQDR
ncbi:MAG: hypothetical protein K2P60_09230, partial [Lachnospiraceae bacterium]|nr:hypothetical protein [Lachnospiraceae bacterium]